MEAGHTQTRPAARPASTGTSSNLRRYTTETKVSTKTSELFLTLGVIAGILISALVIKGGDTAGSDEFIARHAWLYVAIVTFGYLLSRGIAKSGSDEPYGVVEPEGDVRGNAAH